MAERNEELKKNEKLEKYLRNRGYRKIQREKLTNIYIVTLQNGIVVKIIQTAIDEYHLVILESGEDISDNYREYNSIRSLWTVRHALDRLSHRIVTSYHALSFYRFIKKLVKLVVIIFVIIAIMGLILPAATF